MEMAAGSSFGYGIWSFFGLFLSVLMGAGQVVVRRPRPLNRRLALLFFSLGLIQFYIFYITGPLALYRPEFLHWEIPLLWFLGPLLHSLYQQGVEPSESPGNNPVKGGKEPAAERETSKQSSPGRTFRAVLTFVPGLLAILVVGYYHLAHNRAEIDRAVRSFQRDFDLGWPEWLAVAAISYTALFLLIQARQGRRLLPGLLAQENGQGRLAAFLLILGSGLFQLLTGLVALVSGEILFLQITGGLMVLSMVLAYLVGHRYPRFFQELRETAIEGEVRRGGGDQLLRGLDLTGVEKQLNHLMVAEKLYRREDLTLQDVADACGLSPHQLSCFVNRHLNQSFSRFVNGYRVAEARELLKKEADWPIIRVAYEVGFNSKSSFNRAFTKILGKTPSQVRDL